MRKYIRSIAKARLQALGVQHVNRHFGNGMRSANEKHYRNNRVYRALLERRRKNEMPLWRRVIFGNLAKDGWRAQMGMAKRRRIFAR